MPAETYEGRPCKLGHTLRRRSTRACVACNRDDARERMYRKRLDHLTYYSTLLKNRRYKALKRREARNG